MKNLFYIFCFLSVQNIKELKNNNTRTVHMTQTFKIVLSFLSYLFKLLFVHGRQSLPLGQHSTFVPLPHHSSVNIVDYMLHNIMALFGVLSFRISPTITWLVWPSIRKPMFWHLYEYDFLRSNLILHLQWSGRILEICFGRRKRSRTWPS